MKNQTIEARYIKKLVLENLLSTLFSQDYVVEASLFEHLLLLY